jgi:hypothetical protein
MTSQGTPHGRFQRAIQHGRLFDAEIAAREIGHPLGLADALALLVLIAVQSPERFDRAAVRWHGRFELEVRGLALWESQLALAAVAGLPNDPDGAVSALARIGERRGVRLGAVRFSHLDGTHRTR